MSNATVQYRELRSVVEAGLIFSAVTALLLGSAVYLLDRDWADTMLLAPFIAYQWPTSAVFGALGGFLPALVHAYAIPVLIIVALRPWPWTRPWVCLLWFTLALTLEWLQSDAAGSLFFAAGRLPGDRPLLRYLESYAVHGQFDYIDLLATGVGCLTALVVTIAIVPHGQGS
ncbi:MAG: hypothetical protein WCH04_06685 [Gammaproteobacteria bacterium]